MSLKEEIFEQPEVLRNLFLNQKETIQTIAAEIKAKDIQYVFLTARGTSDHAGLYLKYIFGNINQLPVALAAPSLFSIYESPPDLKGALVIAISQSGMSPDILKVVEEGKKQGAPTLVITNNPDSPLAKTADYVIDVMAGEEKAVAATKSYTAQLMAVAMLSIALSEDHERWAELEMVPEYIKRVLTEYPSIQKGVERFYYMRHCVVLSRGFNYATAFEWSLKLKELAYVIAEPYSSADFLHGPIAIVEEGFPVMAVVNKGAIFDELFDVIRKLKEEKKATLFILSNDKKALAEADVKFPLPEEMLEWISPIVSIVPAQLFCYWLTNICGLNTEAPRGLRKITETI